jgi:GTP-binding protein
VIRVPPGTQVERWDGTRYDLVSAGQEVTIAQGGPGGRGNKRFAGPTRQTPRLAERGLPGEEGTLELRLKLLADVGLVGLPNAGKSSLLARMTRATPKVGAYPFTTLEPVLGTLQADDRQLVIADIPGLIEGASDGAGLGHDFLAHVERTRLLVHVVELLPVDQTDPVDNHATIEQELALHDPRLAELPRLLALSKADLVTPEAGEAAVAEWSERVDCPVLLVSSASGQGLEALSRELLRRVPLVSVRDEAAEGAGESGVAEYQVFRPAARRSFEVEKVAEHEWRVVGEGVDRLIARYDLEHEDALAHMEGGCGRWASSPRSRTRGSNRATDVESGGVRLRARPRCAALMA